MIEKRSVNRSESDGKTNYFQDEKLKVSRYDMSRRLDVDVYSGVEVYQEVT